MNHFVLSALLVYNGYAFAMQQTISKESFHPHTVIMLNVTTNALIMQAKAEKINLETGLASIISEIQLSKANALLNDPQVIKRANEILQSLHILKSQPSYKQAFSIISVIPSIKTHEKQELTLYDGSVKKVVISPVKALEDISKLLLLNTNLNTQTISIDCKAFLVTYFYLTQQNCL